MCDPGIICGNELKTYSLIIGKRASCWNVGHGRDPNQGGEAARNLLQYIRENSLPDSHGDNPDPAQDFENHIQKRMIDRGERHYKVSHSETSPLVASVQSRT